MDDKIKALANRLLNHEVKPKKLKVTRTLRLEDSNYLKLLKFCHSKKLNIGDIVDDLIAILLEHLANEEVWTPKDSDPEK